MNDPRRRLAETDDSTSNRMLTGLPALAFAGGTLLEGYGVFVALGPGAILEASLCIGAGLLLQAASGALDGAGQRGANLTNPFSVVQRAVERVRERVRAWDYRE
jgi:hypothetical protein